MIDADVKLGTGAKILFPELVNIYGCTIGDGSHIGPFVEITRGVTIGKKCKISSHSFICTAVTLEDHVFIGHGVMFTNDLYPKTDRQVEYLPTLIKTGASIGSGAVILCGITVGQYAIVGAGAVITKDVPDLSIVVGNPGKVIKSFKNYHELVAHMEKRQKLSSGDSRN